MKSPNRFLLRRRIIWATVSLLIPVSLFFAWITHTATRQIEEQIAQASLSSLQLYVNTLHNEILGTEQFLNQLIYENDVFQKCASLEDEAFSEAYQDSLSDLLESGFQNNADLTALAIYRPQSRQFYLKLNSIITYEYFEPDVRTLAMQQICKQNIALGWYLANAQAYHYLCRVVEYGGCFLMAIYDLPQVITNASIFYGQKGNLALFTGREMLANDQFITSNGLQLDYTIDEGYYFSGGFRDYMVVQKQLINFKVALIDPYSATNSSIRLLYLAPFLYILVADEKYSCHILKPLECIDIPGIAGILRYFLLFILLAYLGIIRHSFDPKSSTGSSKSEVFISFYYSLFATRFSSSCASSKPKWV